jgi:hypothetical protein
MWRFQDLTAASMKLRIFWDVLPCQLRIRHYIPEDSELDLNMYLTDFINFKSWCSDVLSKMKVGLSNHQSVCVPPPPTNNFEPIGGFSWNLVDSYFHSMWRRLHIFNLVASAIAKWLTFKLLRWITLITFEPCGGFGWNFVWRWWHWILCTVSLCRESRHINSSQNFLLFRMKAFKIFVKIFCNHC